MALERSLGFYTQTQLHTYKHETLAGTIHFSVEATISGDRDKISGNLNMNTVAVTFSSTATIDRWECRATLEGTPHGIGVGLLLGSGNSVAAGAQTEFDVQNTALTFGDGMYRIDVYVQKENIWYGG